MDQKVSAIVPVFNEDDNVLKVASAICNSKYFGELIVVDDGSCLETKTILHRLTGIKLLVHSQNLGKSQALRTGLLEASFSTIAFIDADIRHFETHHFDSLVDPVVHNLADLSLGERSREPFYYRRLGISAALGGERASKLVLLKKHLNAFDNFGSLDGYLIEVKLNQIFFDHYRIAKVPLDGVDNHYKSYKYGLHGLLRDYRVLTHIANYLGRQELLRQMDFVRNLSPITHPKDIPVYLNGR